MRNVLVTGGLGFIGTHLVRALKKTSIGYHVTVLDKDGYSVPPSPPWDAIVHLAALGRVSDCERDPVACMRDNMLLTAEILQQRTGAFVFAGTCSPPTTIYGMSKQWGEQLATYEAVRRGTALRILRFTTVCGEGENKDKLIPRAIDSVRNGTPFVLSESALPVEYVYVGRVVDEIMVALSDMHHRPGSITGPKKLCDGTIKTKKQLMEFAENVVHSDPQPA